MSEVYCLPNAPRQRGDLWVRVSKKGMVTVMDPAGAHWRGRKFTVEEFRKELQASR